MKNLFFKRFLFTLCLVLTLAMATGCNDSKTSSSSSDAPSVKAEQLANAYMQNIENADKQYKDKTIIINGQVLRKGQYNNSSSYYAIIYLEEKNGKLYNVSIAIDENDTEKINNIKEDDFIKVKGTCQGYVKQNDPNKIAIQIDAEKIY